MAYPNGQLPASALTTVQGTIQLGSKTARAWKRLQAAAKSKLGRQISIAGPAGGYRSLAVQRSMRIAFFGTAADKRRWGLSLTSTVAPSLAGGSRHGDGLALDVVGTPLDRAFLLLAEQYGFTRPWTTDPNHLLHDGKTATAVTVAALKPAKKQATVVVRSADTFSKIAALHHLSVDELHALNPSIDNIALIRIGQKIRVA